MRRPPPSRAQPLPEADNFCLAVARHVVGGPESVKVSSVEGQELMVIELSAPPEDVGRLVGRDGRTIGAIRTLAEALAQRIGKRIIVDVQPVARRA
jgi:predicted RNA-binding protein YlqC (UPF0109 family)